MSDCKFHNLTLIKEEEEKGEYQNFGGMEDEGRGE